MVFSAERRGSNGVRRGQPYAMRGIESTKAAIRRYLKLCSMQDEPLLRRSVGQGRAPEQW